MAKFYRKASRAGKYLRVVRIFAVLVLFWPLLICLINSTHSHHFLLAMPPTPPPEIRFFPFSGHFQRTLEAALLLQWPHYTVAFPNISSILGSSQASFSLCPQHLPPAQPGVTDRCVTNWSASQGPKSGRDFLTLWMGKFHRHPLE